MSRMQAFTLSVHFGDPVWQNGNMGKLRVGLTYNSFSEKRVLVWPNYSVSVPFSELCERKPAGEVLVGLSSEFAGPT